MVRVLAVGAHPADIPKRAGGTIARYITEGHEVHLVTLTFGETKESSLLWRKPGMTVKKAIEIRKREFLESAKILGAEPITLGFRDNFSLNPLTEKKEMKIAELIRRTRPHIILTHWLMAIFDDHRTTAKSLCLTARDMAADPKKLTEAGLEPWDVQNIYLFEPSLELYGGSAHITGFLEDLYIDVSDFWDKKMEALKPFWNSQNNNSEYYTQVALYCGTQCGTSAKVKYAERFVQYRPKCVYKLFPLTNFLLK